MSIASEITRLQGAKADLKTAIEGKGVTVPSATKLDGYADLVDAISQGGGGSTLVTKNISANGTYNASSDSADGYSQVNVSVPASAVDSGTKSITANGNNQDVVGYAAVNVNVPNTYSAGDEGKVVSNGALVAQGSDTVTDNDTYDTTLISSLTVNVSGGGGGGAFEVLKTVTISENVTSIKIDYDASWANDYDVIFVTCFDTLSASDYVYYGFNSQSPSIYTGSNTKHYITALNRKISGVWNNTILSSNSSPSNTTGFPSYLYFKTYVATKYFTTGTTITVYGGKFS